MSSLRKARRGVARSTRTEIMLSEYSVQVSVAAHLDYRGVDGLVWFAVPNGEARNPVTGARLKAQGVKPGVPDIMLFHAGKAYGLELKRARGGHVSAHQKEMLRRMGGAGVMLAVAYGIDEAIEQLLEWGLIRPDNEMANRPMSRLATLQEGQNERKASS